MAGGKNDLDAKWVTDWVIPEFTKQQKAKGVNVTVKYDGTGVDDGEYKAKIALDFNTDIGGDIVELDGIWLGEFAQGGQIRTARRRGRQGQDRCLGRLGPDPGRGPGARQSSRASGTASRSAPTAA